MKYIWFGILVLIMFSSCSREDDQPFELTAEGLVGTWEQYQFEGSTGVGSYRTPNEATGRTITFLPDGKWNSINFFECEEGEYRVKDHVLTMIFQCGDQVDEQIFRLSREGDQLKISPSCFEGCSYFFKKI